MYPARYATTYNNEYTIPPGLAYMYRGPGPHRCSRLHTLYINPARAGPRGRVRYPYYTPAGFEVSVKFLQYFSESKFLHKFHEIYDTCEIYEIGRHRSAAARVQCWVADKFQILSVPAMLVPKT